MAFVTVEEYEARQTEIRSRIAELDTQFKGQPFDDESRSEWNALNDEVESNKAVIDELHSRAERVRDLADTERHTEKEKPFYTRPTSRSDVPEDIYDLPEYRNRAGGSRERLRQAYRDGAMRSVETSTFAHPDAKKEEQQEHIERLLERADNADGDFARRILETNSPLYRRAFGKYLTGAGRSPDEERALSLTGSAGGFAVPVVLDPTVILTSNGVVNPIRQVARIETIVGNVWEGVTSAGITAAYSAEAVETTDNSPTLAQPTVNVEKAQAFVPFSIEVAGDWGALQSEMARLLQDAKDTLEADKFLTGAGHGSQVPQGLLVGGTAVVNTAATAVFAVADVYSLEEALAPRWRPRASILANRKQFNKVRQFDTAGGASLWVQLQVAAPPTLIGYPAYEWSNMSSAGTTGASIVTIGDFSQFLIVDRIGMNVEVIPHLFGTVANFPTGQRGLYAYWRNSSQVLTQLAFKTLKLL